MTSAPLDQDVSEDRVERKTGRVQRVSGPLVIATGLTNVRLYDVVTVGEAALLGEAIRLDGPNTVIQVYEDTSGLCVGAPVTPGGRPLSVELGPGLLGGIFDGIQRPLRRLAEAGAMLERGVMMPALDRDRLWDVQPTVENGDVVSTGDVIAVVRETGALEHRVLVPADCTGPISQQRRGNATVVDVIAHVGATPVRLAHTWPVRTPRPYAHRHDPNTPLITGQRVIDSLFPIALGGSAAIPGGFGTGKTVQEQTLARWAHADVIVYVACGERGNELTELLETFANQTDPRTGAPLMDRTILIANTSNMPIAAREASIYTGITLAEYYRDQGYDVALMADSTSRWGEALREISNRLEEMPGEEGYPAYLAARLAEFYERAGLVTCLGAQAHRGSVSVIGAVSPPGGDFSEPMTQHSLRLVGTFWALDTDLARRRHFPAIHWTHSYTLFELADWFAANVDPDWQALRSWALGLLQEESELLAVVQLLGVEALAQTQQLTLHLGRLVREDFLQQSAFDPVDAFCPPRKQAAMLRVLRAAHEQATRALSGDVGIEALLGAIPHAEISGMRSWPVDDSDDSDDSDDADDVAGRAEAIIKTLVDSFEALTQEPML